MHSIVLAAFLAITNFKNNDRELLECSLKVTCFIKAYQCLGLVGIINYISPINDIVLVDVSNDLTISTMNSSVLVEE